MIPNIHVDQRSQSVCSNAGFGVGSRCNSQCAKLLATLLRVPQVVLRLSIDPAFCGGIKDNRKADSHLRLVPGVGGEVRMNWKLLQRWSLKARVTVFTLAIFFIGVWGLSWYVSQMLHEDMERALGKQQFSTASFIAAEVNGELDDRMRALERIAGDISPDILGHTAAVQALPKVETPGRVTVHGGFPSGAAWRCRGPEAPVRSIRMVSPHCPTPGPDPAGTRPRVASGHAVPSRRRHRRDVPSARTALELS
jgi:hypothetical protein